MSMKINQLTESKLILNHKKYDTKIYLASSEMLLHKKRDETKKLSKICSELVFGISYEKESLS